MSNHKALWCDEALREAKEWEKCREAGAELLKSLGY